MFASLLLGLAALSMQALPAPAVPGDTAALVVGARTITVFRASYGPTSADERAVVAKARIDQMLKSGVDTVALWPFADGTAVILNHFPVFAITPADVDSLRGETMVGRADEARFQLELVVEEYRESRSIRSIIQAALLALLATVLLAGWLRGLRWLGQRTQRLIDSVEREMLPKKFPGLARVFRPDGIARALRAVFVAILWALGLVATYLYLTFVLTSFPWTRPAGGALGGILGNILLEIGRGLRDGIPDVIAIIVITTLAVFLGRAIDRVFRAVQWGTITLPLLHPETAEPTRRIAKGLLWLFAIVIIYPHLPASDSAAFKGVTVFAGVLVSFGSAGLAGQVMSGLALMYSRGYLVGDFVSMSGHQGTVLQIGMLTTRLRTVKDEYVSIPNVVVMGGATVNYSAAARAGHTLFMYTSATIGYDVPRTQVEGLMLEAAAKCEGVVSSPEPFVLMRGLGDYNIEYQLNVAMDPLRARELPWLYSQLHARVYDAFAAAGVEILSPSYFALRDGNRATIPEAMHPGLEAGFFRVRVDGPRG
jgi:small-conductance mechanosensitive channel